MRATYFFIIIFLFAFLIFISHYLMVGNIVWGDGQYYYSILRSLYIDHDLYFANELVHFSRSQDLTTTGMIANKYSLGPAILWLPFFAAAHMLATIFKYIGFYIRPDGYSGIYQLATGIGSVFYGVTGLVLCFLTSMRYFSKKVSLLAVCAIFFASNLFFYICIDPINSHAVSFFAASLVVYIWSDTKKKDKRHVLILGILTGILAMIRNQDFIFILPIAAYFFLLYKISDVIGKCLFYLCGVFLAFLPQIIVWYILYGQIGSPYISGGEQFNFAAPKILPVLFNTNNGLFVYSPIVLLSLPGLYLLRLNNKIIASSGIWLFILQLLIIASWHYWNQGASYGGRMFISLMPFFILGFAAFADKYRKNFIYLLILVTILAGVNQISIIRFLLINP